MPRTEKQGRVEEMMGKPHITLACETFTQTKRGRQLGLGTGCAVKWGGLAAQNRATDLRVSTRETLSTPSSLVRQHL